MDDNIFKVIAAAVTSFISYCFYMIKRNKERLDGYDMKINEHDKRLAISDERFQNILTKLNDLTRMSNNLENANSVILQALTKRGNK